ncbi:MAG: tetratricopeptide repeat protein, partial [Flexibacteraceae bacterium]
DGLIVNTKKYPYDIDVALRIAKKKRYMKVYMTLLYYKSMVLDANANFAESFKATILYKAEAKKLNHVVYYQLALNKMASAAFHARKYEIAEECCNELIDLDLNVLEKGKSYSCNRLTSAYNILFMVYCDQKMYDKALKSINNCIYYSDSLAKLSNSSDSVMAVNASINLGILYSKMGDHQKAVNQYLKVFQKYDIERDYETKSILNSNLGNGYLALGQYSTALKYLNLCEADIEDMDVRSQYFFYKAKRDAFVGLNRMDSAFLYYQYLERASDSLYNIDKQEALAEVSEKYKTDKLKAENKTLVAEKEAIKAKEWLYWSIIGFGILLGAVGINAFRNQRKLKLKQEELYKAEKENLANQLIAKEAKEEKFRIELELKEAKEQEILTQLQFKSRETTSLATIALQNANLLAEIQGIIKGLNGNQEESDRIIKEVNSLIGNQKHLDAFWDTFKRHFQEVHPRFFEILEELHPKLTLNDHKVCAFLVLGMSNNEISLLQNIEPRSFLRTRQRLKEKMSLDASIEIEAYLNSIVKNQ